MSGFVRTIERTVEREKRQRKAKRAHFMGRGCKLPDAVEPEPLKKGTGGMNPCFRPSNEAYKVDLREFHQEDMALRRAHQRGLKANVLQQTTGSIAGGNRHGGEHQHKREIARRRGDAA